jgi:DNA topoisomerase VI subunit A
MNEAERVAYIQGMIACATIRALGMQAENMQREKLDQSMAYVEKDFTALIEEYGIHHNAILSEFYPK